MDGKPLRADNHATSRKEAETDALLRQSIRASGLEGKPLNLQASPMKVSSDALVSGMLGAPAWARRLKQIHDARTTLTAELEAGWADHARRFRTRPDEFARRWRGFVASRDLATLNTLIQKHNDYYLIEARIPMIYPSGRYAIPTGIEYPQQPVTPEDLLQTYPPDLDMALYFSERT